MKVAVEGCAHGDLEIIYDTIRCLEEKEDIKIDLLICCGDFQSARNEEDLHCMAIPPKYNRIHTFYKYYNGEKVAPLLTIFIGGNHEASNYLQELPYGGWVAPNIYYLGYAGVINIRGVRIGGLSGIYKSQDYMKGHYEYPPYSDNSKRSIYHVRNLEVFRLKQLSQPINIFLSHDWPTGVWKFGNKEELLHLKPHFKDDIDSGKLGSKAAEEILYTLKPDYWFSAHLHCKFAALIPHDCGKVTKFLALDKCLPHRSFLQVVEIEHDPNLKMELTYDLEWLAILKLTNHLISVKSCYNYLPGPGRLERWCFKPTQEEREMVLLNLNKNLVIPNNFVKMVQGYEANNRQRKSGQLKVVFNPQTDLLCKMLNIDDPLRLLITSHNLNESSQCLTFTNESQNSSLSNSSLVLPKPVNSTECEIEYIEQPTKVEEDIDIFKGCGEVLKTENHPDSPAMNKFRRRNAAIYRDIAENS